MSGITKYYKPKTVNIFSASSKPKAAVNACELYIIQRDVSVTGSYIKQKSTIWHEKAMRSGLFCSSFN